MPVFECSRCNELSYSSSATNVGACAVCGSERNRKVSDAASFAEAKAVPRAVSYGDHSIALYDDPAQVAHLGAQFVDQAVIARGLVIAAVPQDLENAMLELLHPDDAQGIAWEPPSDTYGPTFSPDAAVGRFVEMAEIETRPIFILAAADMPIQDFTSREGWVEYERRAHEAAVEHGITALCLYDVRLHNAEMLAAGLATHGLKADAGEIKRNEEFDYEPPTGA